MHVFLCFKLLKPTMLNRFVCLNCKLLGFLSDSLILLCTQKAQQDWTCNRNTIANVSLLTVIQLFYNPFEDFLNEMICCEILKEFHCFSVFTLQVLFIKIDKISYLRDIIFTTDQILFIVKSGGYTVLQPCVLWVD